MRFKTVLVAVAVAAGLAMLGVSGPAAAATGTLYDQNSNDFGNAIYSVPDAYGAGTGYGSQAADDFVVPAHNTWMISEVDVTGYPGSCSGGDSVEVYVYSDAAGMPGTQVAHQTVTPSDGLIQTDCSFQIPVDIGPLAAGTYWLSVQADDPVFWYWEASSVVNGEPAMWQNPGGAFGMGCTTWGDLNTCSGNAFGQPVDLMFALFGTSTPVYGGTAGQPNCVGKSVSALSHEYNGLSAAAQALAFDSVKALQQSIKQYCRG